MGSTPSGGCECPHDAETHLSYPAHWLPPSAGMKVEFLSCWQEEHQPEHDLCLLELDLGCSGTVETLRNISKGRVQVYRVGVLHMTFQHQLDIISSNSVATVFL